MTIKNPLSNIGISSIKDTATHQIHPIMYLLTTGTILNNVLTLSGGNNDTLTITFANSFSY
jgi:hypothetical protein